MEEGPLLVERGDLKPLIEARVVAVGAVYGRLALSVIGALAWEGTSAGVLNKFEK